MPMLFCSISGGLWWEHCMHRQYLFVEPVDCCFWSFHWVCWRIQNKKKLKRWFGISETSFNHFDAIASTVRSNRQTFDVSTGSEGTSNVSDLHSCATSALTASHLSVLLYSVLNVIWRGSTWPVLSTAPWQSSSTLLFSQFFTVSSWAHSTFAHILTS